MYLAAEDSSRLADISRRCVALYEDLAVRGLTLAGIPDADRLGPAVVALLDGMALRRPSLGRQESQRRTVDALLRLVDGAAATGAQGNSSGPRSAR